MQGMQEWLSVLDDSRLGITCMTSTSGGMLHLMLTAVND